MASVSSSGSLTQKLRLAQKRHTLGFSRGIKKAARFLLAKSQDIVPTDTEFLKESGHVETSGSGGNTSAAVVYDAPYAVVQHENLEFNHKPGESAKYLEKPAREFRDDIKEIIRKETARK